MKITTKFILSIVLIVFVTGTILVAFSAYTQKKLIEEQIERKGTVLAEILSVSSIIPMLNYDYSSVKLYFNTLARDSDIIEAELLDNDYIVKMHTDISRLGEINIPETDEEILNVPFFTKSAEKERTDRYDFYSPLLIEQERIGLFHITLTNRAYLQVIKMVWIKMIALGFFSLLIGIMGAFFLGKQISRPIKELVKAAESVSGDNLKWDVAVNSNDEVGKLARSFREMAERLDKSVTSRIKTEKMAVIGQLSSVLAHEIKNPLEPIKGSVELLKIHYPGEKQIMQLAGIIQEEVTGLISFIDNFLDFARPREPEFRDVDINSLASRTLILIEKMAEDRKIRVETDFSESLPPVRGDASMLKQVILNVLLNAIQASDKGSGQIRITTGTRKGFAEMAVIDYGKGIEKENLKKIFDPFYTTKAEGAGTGLSTCQRIIEQHGGEITIESKPGMWTMVQILLPLFSWNGMKKG